MSQNSCSYCHFYNTFQANNHNVENCWNPNLKKCFVDIVEIFQSINIDDNPHNIKKFYQKVGYKYNYVTIEAVSIKYGNNDKHGQTKLSYMKKIFEDFMEFSKIMENYKLEFYDENLKSNIKLLCDETKINGDFSCSICYNYTSNDNKVLLNCCHEFCGDCTKKLINISDDPTCAYCRTKINSITVKNVHCDAWSKLCLII